MENIEPKQTQGTRECGMLATAAIQGGGKTYQNMHIISKYVKDKLETKVRGRKCLIFDTNGEYTAEEFAKNGIPNFNPKRIALKDIEAWCRDPRVIECRKIDAKSLSIPEKKQALEYVINKIVNCQLVLEDINTYVLKLTNMETIIGKLVALRHNGVDVLISFQSARAVEPRIYQNSRWFRLHYISDDVDEIKGKLPNFTLYKIAQIMINIRYQKGDKRFFVYITQFGAKIEGAFNLADFKDSCSKYLLLNKKKVKDQMLIYQMTEDQARDVLVNQYVDLYYDNPDKPKN
jgi:hypothetical protein